MYARRAADGCQSDTTVCRRMAGPWWSKRASTRTRVHARMRERREEKELRPCHGIVMVSMCVCVCVLVRSKQWRMAERNRRARFGESRLRLQRTDERLTQRGSGISDIGNCVVHMQRQAAQMHFSPMLAERRLMWFRKASTDGVHAIFREFFFTLAPVRVLCSDSWLCHLWIYYLDNTAFYGVSFRFEIAFVPSLNSEIWRRLSTLSQLGAFSHMKAIRSPSSVPVVLTQHKTKLSKIELVNFLVFAIRHGHGRGSTQTPGKIDLKGRSEQHFASSLTLYILFPCHAWIACCTCNNSQFTQFGFLMRKIW